MWVCSSVACDGLIEIKNGGEGAFHARVADDPADMAQQDVPVIRPWKGHSFAKSRAGPMKEAKVA